MDSEYQNCLQVAVALGKTYQQARRDWTLMSHLPCPDYSYLIKYWDEEA